MAYINGKKVLQVVRSVGGAGSSSQLLTTTTDATESSGTYTLALTYLSDTPNVNDYVVYVDNESLSTLYQVTAVDSTNATLDKIGDIGGGGGSLSIPIITILASQQETSVLPDINYVLTQEQIDAFNNNNVVEVILPDGTDFLYQANITSDTTQWGIKVFSKVIVGTDATGDYASSKSLVFITDNITINETTMRSGKQLYQHNINIKATTYDSKGIYANVIIINDSNAPINTFALLQTYLTNKLFAFDDSSYLQCSGSILDSNSYALVGVCYYSNTAIRFMHSKNGVSLTYGSCTSFDNITDNVVEL